MSFFEAIFLGFLQGATEFLPVSSSGHLVLAQHLLDGFEQPGVLFDVLLHVGTMFAVILYFWRDLTGLVTSLWRTDPEASEQKRTLGLLILGSIPTAVIGLSFKDQFENLFERPDIVCFMLIVTGLLLFFAERYRSRDQEKKTLSIADALLVGVAQGMAIIPGISRSGSTIATLLFRGIDGETAARFSFLLALPAVFGAALLSLKHLDAVSAAEVPVYLAGTGTAMLTGFFCIHMLMGVIRRRRLHWFALYCWIAAIIGLTIFL